MGAYGGRGPLLMGITWAETAIGTLCVAARTYAAVRCSRRGEWDLFWVLLSLSYALSAQIMLTIAAAAGIGNHIAVLTGPQIVKSQKFCWVCQLLIIQGITMGKIAVVALLLSIQGQAHARRKIVLHVIWMGNVAFCILQVTAILLSCHPYYKLWDMPAPGDCNFLHIGTRIGYAQGSWAVFSDIVLAIYPITIFWSLKLSWKKKLGLCILMGGGFIAAIAGILKTVFIEDVTKAEDHTYVLVPLLASAASEQWLVIILGSVPQLRVLFNLLRGGHRDGTSAYAYTGGSEERKGSSGKPPDPYTLDLTTYAESSFAVVQSDGPAQVEHVRLREINVTTNYEVRYDGGLKLPSRVEGDSLRSISESEAKSVTLNDMI